MAVTIATQPMIAEGIQKLPDCAQKGESYLTVGNRTLLATEVLVAVQEATGPKPTSMKYDCDLEFFALFYLKNLKKLYFSLTSNLDVAMLKFQGIAENFGKEVPRKMKKRMLLFEQVILKRRFGCNYSIAGGRYRVVCLFV
ncbi:hypothetical protein RB195_019958 [Necator americanus]